MMNMAYLKVFITIVESGGFISAAQKLHRSQPTLTATIKQLEALLGFALFDRKSYKSKLTPSGERFYVEAKKLMDEYLNFESRVDYISQGIETSVHIDWDIALDFKPYIPVINFLAKQYPKTSIQLQNHDFSNCRNRLLQEQTDLCLAAYDRSNAFIECFPLKKIKLIAVSNPDYYQANKDHSFMHIMVADTIEPLAQLGISPLSEHHPQCLVRDMHMSKELILSGLGLGRLPEHLIKEHIASGLLLALPEKQFSSATITIYCMRLKNKPSGNFIMQFWDTLKKMAMQNQGNRI